MAVRAPCARLSIVDPAKFVCAKMLLFACWPFSILDHVNYLLLTPHTSHSELSHILLSAVIGILKLVSPTHIQYCLPPISN